MSKVDSDLLTLALVGECRGWEVETELLAHWRDHRDLAAGEELLWQQTARVVVAEKGYISAPVAAAFCTPNGNNCLLVTFLIRPVRVAFRRRAEQNEHLPR